jgi:hypothetical protein
MAAKLTRLTHKIVILVEQSFIICSSRSRRPVRKLLDKSSYNFHRHIYKIKNKKTEQRTLEV